MKRALLLLIVVGVGEASRMLHLSKSLRNVARQAGPKTGSLRPIKPLVVDGAKPKPGLVRTLGNMAGRGLGGGAVLVGGSVVASEIIKATEDHRDRQSIGNGAVNIYENPALHGNGQGSEHNDLDPYSLFLIVFGALCGALGMAVWPLYCVCKKCIQGRPDRRVASIGSLHFP